MKRFILMAAAAALLAIPAAEAQKVNKEATLSKLEKSDADIANPKKNAKAATWINRGRVTKNLHVYNISHTQHLQRVLNIPIGNLGNVYQAVLMDADIHKNAKINDVADGTLQHHTGL